MLLLLYGCSDGVHVFDDVASLSKFASFPITIPNLLGYGETSKPTDLTLYNFKSMAQDIFEVVVSESLTTIAPIGHD